MGFGELEDEVAGWIVGGLDSSPERVIARSRPFRTSTSPCAGPFCGEEVPADRDPLPSSIRSSAHSHDILYLFVRAPKDVANCLWSANVPLGFVLERRRERGLVRWRMGDVVRDGRELSGLRLASAKSCWYVDSCSRSPKNSPHK